MIEVVGKYVFDPLSITNAENLFKPFWVIIQLEDDTTYYYSWFVEKRYGIKIQRPAWVAMFQLFVVKKPHLQIGKYSKKNMMANL